MTLPRGKIEASLAERGRPVMWVTESEAAVMAGYPPDCEKFREELPELVKLGFPAVMPWNGRRFAPDIEVFNRRRVDSLSQQMRQSTPMPPLNIEGNDNGRQPGKWKASH